MGLRDLLRKRALRADVPVFPVFGTGVGVDRMHLETWSGVTLVDSPRQAVVLLVAGEFRPDATPSILHVHDQIPGPRVTVRWRGSSVPGLQVTRTPDPDVASLRVAVGGAFGDLMHGAVASEPAVLPDVDPVEWRGVGPYGHGGMGMTGGTPFGRPLTGRAADRDGLELDQLPVVVGPWFRGFAPGLSLGVKIQGDVVQDVTVLPPAVTQLEDDIFHLALSAPTSIARLELARAAHHLAWGADVLRISGLSRLGYAMARLAVAPLPDPLGIRAILSAARRRGLRRMLLGGVGRLPSGMDPHDLGPVARAGGYRDDARSDDPAYRALGFVPVVEETGDAWARFAVRIEEAARSVALAQDAGDALAFGDGIAEAPDGTRRSGHPSPSERLFVELPSMLVGLEWGDVVTTVQSLALDLTAVSGTVVTETA